MYDLKPCFETDSTQDHGQLLQYPEHFEIITTLRKWLVVLLSSAVKTVTAVKLATRKESGN